MDSYRPGGGDRRANGDKDSYRPPRRDDDFRPPWPPREADNGMYYFRGSRDEDTRRDYSYRPRPRYPDPRDGPRRRDPYRRPYNPARIAERPLMRLNNQVEDSSLLDPNADLKFRNLDEITDSEEEVMAVSEDEGEGRGAKRARVTANLSDTVQTAPKWSNPDPYTSLPPVGDADATAKRTDVLKLIRKARVDAQNQSDIKSTADDFISFDVNASDTEDSAEESVSQSMGATMSLAEAPAPAAEMKQEHVLGKRKRGDATGRYNLETQSDPLVYSDKYVRGEWQAKPGKDPAPWLVASDSNDLPGMALHKEIIDFYDWVKPKDFERAVRDEVFQRLRDAFKRLWPGGELKAFGSYAAGLYLPTADMDLVYLRRGFRPGMPLIQREAKNLLFSCSRFLKDNRIAKPTSITVISGAKVPIIKFVDRISGLKVDLSFDNDSGVVAIDTFQRWKESYPAMPIIVAIVKQYLMIRGLNDVSTGGLGGFSTICLVTSLLQFLPASSQPINLGEALVEFFNLYGNLFDRNSVVIRMDPPKYLDKKSHMPHVFNDKDGRLTIIDPNRPDNNISGGSRLISDIFKCFSSAHRALIQRLDAYEHRDPNSPASSLLGCLVGGNFSLFEAQRQVLYDLGMDLRLIPPPTLPTLPKASKDANDTPSMEPARGSKTVNDGEAGLSPQTSSVLPEESKEPSKAEKRALRFKKLRPELAASVGTTISVTKAMELGGYKTREAMHNDLVVREGAMSKLEAKKKK
ncbi:topoisomerase TRF4 [Exophiala viscosa]|uniref:topoisomerase TRF4 n=1 Tax=Exophiala viscosa TaxID=2486360 RepID=UPI0021A1EAB1|nr:topoisomerase TRF4 [Exophiala viscosa]